MSRSMRSTVSRVMPARMGEDRGGVRTMPFLFTMKMFSPEASATKPEMSSRIASS